MSSPAPDRYALQIRFRGIVQGVGFRAHVQHHCRVAGVTGWVRNLEDGSVAAELVGSRGAVDEALRRIQAGRPHQISSIDQVELAAPSLEPSTFEIRR